MKLKFKADATDVLIFVIFAIFLLYVVCLGVLNFPTLALEGHFYGLNPFPAFAPNRIAATLVLYFLFLAGIFMSVSSYFFERESGLGFSTEKSDKGYSRWCKEKEMKQGYKMAMIRPGEDLTKAAGVPLILKDNEVWVDNGEYHSLVIGATGSGKTQTVIFPTVNVLAKKRESMIITDPKGEIYENTSNMLREKGYNVLILNFRDPQQGNAWNPLSLPYRIYKSGNQDKAIELLDDLAANILYEEKSGNADPFWEKTSADYFSGLALGMFEDTTEDKVNLNTISLMTTVGEEKFGGGTYIKSYFETKDPSSAAYTNASGTIMAPNETKGSIISVFKQKIKLFASRENLSEMLSHSDFDLKTIGEKPTALFIVIQDEKKTYHSLVTILLKQCYETLISVAQEHGGKLPIRTNFLLDEFANMPPLKDITTMITAARSRQVRFTMIIQNFAQLDQVYGKENAETIKGNCGNIIYLITTELKALEEISKMCGEVKSKKDDKTASTPLVTISELQRMKQFEVIIMRIRQAPFKTKFTPDFKMHWDKEYPKATYPTREKQEVHTFDIREFVKEKKKEKLMEMMNNPQGAAGTPGGMGMPSMGGIPGMGNMPGMGAMNGLPNMSNMPNGLAGMPPLPGMGKAPGLPNMPQSNSGISSSSRLAKSGFNVDDLVKKIDAKIAQIEAEEKKKKEQAIAEAKDMPKEEEKEAVQEAVIQEKSKEEELKPVIASSTSSSDSKEIEKQVEPKEEASIEVSAEEPSGESTGESGGISRPNLLASNLKTDLTLPTEDKNSELEVKAVEEEKPKTVFSSADLKMDFSLPKLEKKEEPKVEEKSAEEEKPKTVFSSADLKMDFPLPKPKKIENSSNLVMSLPEQKSEIDTKPHTMTMNDLLSSSSFREEEKKDETVNSIPQEIVQENIQKNIPSQTMEPVIPKPMISEPVREEPKKAPEVIIHQEQIPEKEIDITDDQFFDDFFDD